MLRRRRTSGGKPNPKAQPQAVVYAMSSENESTEHKDGQHADYNEAYEMHTSRAESYDDALDAIFAPLQAGESPPTTTEEPATESTMLSLSQSLTNTQQPPALLPLPAKIGLYPDFVRDVPETIVMREQWSWVGDDFEIATLDGREVLNMRAKFFSASLRKEFLAPNGDLLFTLRLRLNRILRSFYLDLPDSTTVLDMPQHWGWAHNRFSVSFKNAFDDKEATLRIQGDFWGRKAEITWEDRVVARIRRQYRNWRGLSGRHTFLLDVAPGVDLALMVALVVGFDEGTRLIRPYGGGGGS